MTQAEHEIEERQQKVRRRIFQIERLAAMPQVVNQLVEALQYDFTPLEKLENIIESDPALASRVLSLANSAYYGFYQEITTVRRAVQAIGFEELRLLALGVGLAEFFNPGQIPAGLDGYGLWEHCLTVSWLARELAEASRHPSPGEVMVAGLLHDLGKLVLATHLVRDYALVLRDVRQGKPYYLAEEEMGVPHALVGFWLAKRWGLPEMLSTIIGSHHDPTPFKAHAKNTCLIVVADNLSKKIGFGLAQEARPVDIAYCLRITGLKMEQLKQVAGRAKAELPAFLEGWHDALG